MKYQQAYNMQMMSKGLLHSLNLLSFQLHKLVLHSSKMQPSSSSYALVPPLFKVVQRANVQSMLVGKPC